MKTSCVIHWIEINPPCEQLKAGAHFSKSRKLLSPERSVFQILWNYDPYFFSWGRIRKLGIGFMDFDSPKMLKKRNKKQTKTDKQTTTTTPSLK